MSKKSKLITTENVSVENVQAQEIEITNLQKLDEQTGEWKDIPVLVEEITGEYSDDLDENGNIIPLDKPIKTKGIGKFIIEQILTTEKSNTEILNKVLKEFEGSKTTMACIAWYKSKLRKEGKIPARSIKTEKTEEVTK